MLKEIADNCPNIKYLDLWRAKSMTADGLNYLASKAENLVSLDMGNLDIYVSSSCH